MLNDFPVSCTAEHAQKSACDGPTDSLFLCLEIQHHVQLQRHADDGTHATGRSMPRHIPAEE